MTSHTHPDRASLTVDDIRRHAEEIRTMAVAKTKAFVAQDATKVAVASFVVAVGLISLAYYLGARAAHRELAGTRGR